MSIFQAGNFSVCRCLFQKRERQKHKERRKIKRERERKRKRGRGRDKGRKAELIAAGSLTTKIF